MPGARNSLFRMRLALLPACRVGSSEIERDGRVENTGLERPRNGAKTLGSISRYPGEPRPRHTASAIPAIQREATARTGGRRREKNTYLATCGPAATTLTGSTNRS